MKPFLYRTDCIYTCVRRGFSEQDTWREALGLYEPLLAYAANTLNVIQSRLLKITTLH